MGNDSTMPCASDLDQVSKLNYINVNVNYYYVVITCD